MDTFAPLRAALGCAVLTLVGCIPTEDEPLVCSGGSTRTPCMGCCDPSCFSVPFANVRQ